MNNEKLNGGEAFNVEAAALSMIYNLPFDSPTDCRDAYRQAGVHLEVALKGRAERMQRDHDHRKKEEEEEKGE